MRAYALVLIATLAAGCAAKGPAATRMEPAPPPAEDMGPIAALAQARAGAGAGDYCLGAGDLVVVSVLGWEAMQNQQVRVSPTGMINLPVVGNVPAAGRTEDELREELVRRLRAGYVRDPQVSVFVQRFQSQQVSVTGAVARPGLYSLSRDSRTIYDVLAQAGGMTGEAGGRVLFSPAATSTAGCGAARSATTNGALPHVAVAQNGAAVAPKPIEIELDAPVAPGQPNPLTIPVVGGDSIVVSRGRFMVDGWVARPGLYGFTPGMTAYGAMSVAGGALFPADLGNTRIVRARRDGSKELLAVDLNKVGRGEAQDISLREGDVVQFHASTIKMVPYSFYWVFNNLFRVGAGVSVAGV
jgi:polysaccharide export outer membrane protein